MATLWWRYNYNLSGRGKETGCQSESLQTTDILSVWFCHTLVVWILLRCILSLQWRHNERDDVSNHQPHDCILNRVFRRRPKKTAKLRVTGFCEGNSPVTGEFPTQRASNTENVSIWWRHYATNYCKHQDYIGLIVEHFRQTILCHSYKMSWFAARYTTPSRVCSIYVNTSTCV